MDNVEPKLSNYDIILDKMPNTWDNMMVTHDLATKSAQKSNKRKHILSQKRGALLLDNALLLGTIRYVKFLFQNSS